MLVSQWEWQIPAAGVEDWLHLQRLLWLWMWLVGCCRGCLSEVLKDNVASEGRSHVHICMRHLMVLQGGGKSCVLWLRKRISTLERENAKDADSPKAGLVRRTSKISESHTFRVPIFKIFSISKAVCLERYLELTREALNSIELGYLKK